MCYYTQRIDQSIRFFYYFVVFSVSMLSSYSFGTIIGLIFSGNQQLAVMTSMAAYIVLTFFNNFIIPTKELVWVFQLFSDFTYPKHVFNSLLIVFYGLERCPPEIGSRVLHQYGIDDNELCFSMICALINLIVFNFLVICLLFLKPYLTLNYISHAISLWFLKLRHSSVPQNYEMNGDFGESEKVVSNGHQMAVTEESQTTCFVIEYEDEEQNKIEEESLGKSNELMIAWLDLTYTVTCDSKPKDLLHDLNGIVELGTITALMGPSGAGKTTLLKCLNGQNVWALRAETKFYLSSLTKINPCFVSQNVFDHLVSGLTVEQTLIYASKLKNSKTKGKINHKEMAKQLMDELLISEIRKTNVCDCSGGELKRIIIASELMALDKPNLLCVDEPTSGLDSSAAKVVSITMVSVWVVWLDFVPN